ncbi:MAG TPA: hypothetical protein VLF94_02350 [Chlamydiales bacterium]|nr:hypothetical protein [Chlamydiales bacterium]
MKHLLLIALLVGCTKTNPWNIDSISAGDSRFNGARLRYISAQRHPSLIFEMLKVGEEVQAFLSLTRYRLSPDCKTLVLTIHGETHEEAIVPHQGLMRVRLSSDTTNKLIQALQSGEKVDILVDGFEESLEPGQFSGSFSKFVGRGHFFQNLIQGPIP